MEENGKKMLTAKSIKPVKPDKIVINGAKKVVINIGK